MASIYFITQEKIGTNVWLGDRKRKIETRKGIEKKHSTCERDRGLGLQPRHRHCQGGRGVSALFIRKVKYLLKKTWCGRNVFGINTANTVI